MAMTPNGFRLSNLIRGTAPGHSPDVHPGVRWSTRKACNRMSGLRLAANLVHGISMLGDDGGPTRSSGYLSRDLRYGFPRWCARPLKPWILKWWTSYRHFDCDQCFSYRQSAYQSAEIAVR